MSRRAFERVLIVMFENQYRSYVMRNEYFRGLALQGIDLANCFGVMHPSQTNYIASIAGELCNVTSDEAPQPLEQRTIVDLIEESPLGLGWKAYMDSYIPQNNRWQAEGFAPKDEYPYVIKHNPFSSFANIQQNPARWRRIVSEAELFADLLNDRLPEYCWFTPNMWNDGHYTDGTQSEPAQRAPALVDQAALWLERFFSDLRFPGPASHLPPGTLVVVTFDEADFEADWDQGKKYTYDGPNQIYTVLVGSGVEPGVQEEGYNHYSLMRTIEENFGLGSLGKNDAHANWFQFLWGREFAWGEAHDTQLAGATDVDAAAFGERGELLVVWGAADGRLRWARLGPEGRLSPEGGEALPTAGPAAQPCLAWCGEQLVCAYLDEAGRPCALTFGVDTGWSASAAPLLDEAWACLTLVGFSVGSGAAAHQLMLAGRMKPDSDAGSQATALRSLTFDGKSWQTQATDVGHDAIGDATLGALGPSLYLVFESGGGALSAISYNAAPYNVVRVPDGKYGGSYDDTSLGAWSPSAFHVAHFASGPTPLTPGENEPVEQAYRGRAPLLAATLDGVLHLVHPGAGSGVLVEETFSIAGVMTAKLPVSYAKGDAATTSNGYGTLAQAGWSKQVPVPGGWLAEGGATCFADAGGELVLLFEPHAGAPLRALRGSVRGR